MSMHAHFINICICIINTDFGLDSDFKSVDLDLRLVGLNYIAELVTNEQTRQINSTQSDF